MSINKISISEASAEIFDLPMFVYYQKTYASSMEGNDQKALSVFIQFETSEKLKRLQGELAAIKAEKIPEALLDRLVGLKRKQKYQGYSHWASLMLMWIVNAKK